jgi:broad specificity phosphatase PhoE
MARQIQKYQPRAQIADTPDYVVPGGDIAASLSALGGNVAGRLKQMADKAAAREGENAGLNAGQTSGAGFLDRQAAQGAATGAAVASGELVVQSGDIDHVDAALLARMKALQGAFGTTLPIISGYRDPVRNAAAGGAKGSQHLHGGALDIDLSGVDQSERIRLIQMASSQGFTGIGVYDNSLHLDLGGRRAWGPTYKAASVPAWAAGAIQAHLAGGPAAAAPEAPAPGGLNPQPLALRNDNTIYGDAYDAAAIRTYGWRMQQGVSTEIGDAYDQFKDDPAGFATALGGIRDKYSQDENFEDPRLRDVFDRTFAERSETYTRSVTQRHEARLMEEQQASFADGVDAMRGDLEKQAYLLGANPEADRILAGQSSVILANIAAAEDANVITPSQAQAQREQVNTTLAYARTNGVFASLPTPAAKQAFANDLLTDWASGEGPLTELGFTQVKALADQLSAQALQAQNTLTAESKVELARVQGLMADDVASIATTGVPLDTAANDLTPDRLEALGINPGQWQAQRDRARLGWEATAGMELETSVELSDRLAALKPVPGSSDFVQQSEIYAQAVTRAQEVLKERETDPLGQAARAGMIELAPIDPGSPDSFTLRRQQANAVASFYGTPVTYFRQEERTALTTALYAQPELLPGFAVGVVQAFGAEAPKALAELSDAGPELAYAAGITNATGDNGVISEISRVIAGRADKTINVKLPSDAVMANAAGQVLGSAMIGNQATRAAVANVATILFEGQAAAMGFDPADVKETDSAAFAAWQNAVNRALGAKTVAGVQYGGLAMVNGAQTVAPSSMPADRLQGLVSSLSDIDLAALPPIGSGNGIPVAAWQLQGAQLVAVGDGVYRVALGDPASLEPNYVTGADGGYWLLDAAALEAARATQPTPGPFSGQAWGMFR